MPLAIQNHQFKTITTMRGHPGLGILCKISNVLTVLTYDKYNMGSFSWKFLKVTH